jgi:hypothetical protein
MRSFFALAFVLYASVALAQWMPPQLVPVPPFGIVEVAPTPTIYVNEATGSDSNQGTQARPRKTIPTQLEAGAVVSVTGTYTYNHGSPATIVSHGTAAKPPYIIGGTYLRGGELTGSYLILEQGSGPGAWQILDQRDGKPTDHLVVRHFESQGGVSVASWRGGAVTDSVLFDVKINLNYTNQKESDGDWHCSQAYISNGTKGTVERLWVLDSNFSSCRGDGIQINGNTGGHLALGPVFIGRLTCVRNRQTCVGVKNSHDVVISEIDASEMRPDPDGTNPGAGIVAQYYPMRLYIIGGHIFNSELGVRIASYNGAESDPQASVLIYGVKFDNIRATREKFRPGDAWSLGNAIALLGANKRRIEANIIDNADGGIVTGYRPSDTILINNTLTNIGPKATTPLPPTPPVPPTPSAKPSCSTYAWPRLAYIIGVCAWP